MSIVIIYGQLDQHVRSVAGALKNLNVESVILEKYKNENCLTHRFVNGSYKTIVKIENKTYDITNDCIGFYWRPTPSTDAELKWVNCSREDIFAVQEWFMSSNSIYYLNKHLFTVNPIENEMNMGNKVLQLKIASESGLKIPDTIITNDPAEIGNMVAEQIICKHLSSFISDDGTPAYTKIYDKSSAAINSLEISKMPTIYQEKIQKSYELRVFVVNQQLFPIKINSQLYESSSIDWRAAHCMDFFSETVVSSVTKSSLLSFHRKSGLIYAAYDFIVDKNGNEIFLECNPSGNWLFIGNELAQPITDAIANSLIFQKNII